MNKKEMEIRARRAQVNGLELKKEIQIAQKSLRRTMNWMTVVDSFFAILCLGGVLAWIFFHDVPQLRALIGASIVLGLFNTTEKIFNNRKRWKEMEEDGNKIIREIDKHIQTIDDQFGKVEHEAKTN